MNKSKKYFFKCRAIRRNNEEWVEGYYVGYASTVVTTTLHGKVVPYVSQLVSVEVYPDTVCYDTGIVDLEGHRIFTDDIRASEQGEFRVYQVQGGFAIKADFWSGNIEDLDLSDELIMMPLADVQTREWLRKTTHVRNYHDKSK